MYTINWDQALGRSRQSAASAAPADTLPAEAVSPSRSRVSPVVWALGFTSLLTDISSEMVASVLPMYLVLHLRLSPLAFGVVDGLYQGAAVLLRVAAGFAGDRWRQHKVVAAAGYILSAVCKLGILAAGNAWSAIAAVVALDRTGKGIRTAPRDALITLNSPPRQLATAFGVHRALDAGGAMLGPLVAFGLLAALPGDFNALFVASFCIAVLGVAVLVLFVSAPPAPVHSTSPAPSIAAAVGLLRDTRLRSLVLTAGVLSLATISDAFVFLILQQRAGFSVASFPLLYFGVSLVNAALSAPTGRLADRSGRLRVFLGGHVFLLAVYATLLVPGLGVAHVTVCLLLLGAYYAATDGVLTAVAGASLPAHLCGSGLSLVATATNGARLAASILFGGLWAWQGADAAVAVFMATLLVAVVSVAAVLFRLDADQIHDASDTL